MQNLSIISGRSCGNIGRNIKSSCLISRKIIKIGKQNMGGFSSACGRIQLCGSIAAQQAGNLAQSCNPATGGLGYLDGAAAGPLDLLTLLGLDLSVSLLGLETQAELDLRKTTRNRRITQGWCNQWILLTQMWAEKVTK